MENPEEILHSLEEFSKFRPKDIPRELEEYLCFVAKTGDPVYQWSSIKQLFKEKLINVVNEFYEACPSMDIPPCPNVEIFNYDTMKSFILEKLDTFASAPFTVQRICELLTTPRKEYNRIDKFMRALEKNILVVSTVEPGCKNAENGESIVNGLESEHLPESSNCSSEINVVEMEESPVWQRNEQTEMQFQTTEDVATPEIPDPFIPEIKETEKDSPCSSSQDDEVPVAAESPKEFVPVEDVPINSSVEESTENSVSVEINVDALPAQVEEENSSEPVVSSETLYEVTASDAVSSMDVRDPEIVVEEPKVEETAIQESLKLADSTTSSKSPEAEIVPTVCELDTCPSETKQTFEVQEVQDNSCEIASSENVNTDTDSNQSSASTEPDTVSEVPPNDTETDSNEAKEMSNVESEEGSYGEDSNSSPADTTKGFEGQLEKDFQNNDEESKDEEITSSDKVVVAVPNTSIDDISDDESEAEADVPRVSLVVDDKEQGDVPSASTTPEIDSQVTASTDDVSATIEDVTASIEDVTASTDDVTASSDDVTASSDDLKQDCEETPMEVDSKEKGDFNEAESTCESI